MKKFLVMSVVAMTVSWLPAATNALPVQMLVPGFNVRELPLELNNINNLVFAPDGRLFALCYDGNVLQLKRNRSRQAARLEG